ncbi:tryptophan synthase subunit alpha [Parahalioglobus pacificus]|uniref:Tryptophan synthase alpha chain n=1 Tax=Parahalioglobus pacificus TaxID=930806 RepID=A0A918XGM1_9GAMM|nr:tryptophan synthase subunit alpha [Halioglobus pacificus]NQY03008.1 tryptophan synthase subunit alpha [Halieaceae bacterium]GHD30410.1 tryptophan synthase alpha chain [Halioglobus pacificus]
MSRIAGRFQALAEQGRKALVTYVVAGDPTPEVTAELLHTLVANGADILELGVPFSDPMSEGPTIQLGHERALDSGMRLRGVLELVRQFRETDKDTPLLLMGYANPVEYMGYAAFADAASEAGVDALLTVDVPPEEVDQVNAQLKRVGMDNIFLIAPTTPDPRLPLIAGQASGFIYYVSLKGVTGAGHLDVDDVRRQVERIRAHTTLPVAVGFGIKDADSAEAVAKVADGVVVGSALVQRVADVLAQGESSEAAITAAGALVQEIRAGIDRTTS